MRFQQSHRDSNALRVLMILGPGEELKSLRLSLSQKKEIRVVVPSVEYYYVSLREKLTDSDH